MYYANFLAVLILASIQEKFTFIDGACPASDPGKLLHRMEKTRFYIIHGKERANYTDWAGAYGECEKHGLKLAKVKNMLTMAVVGRALEKHVGIHQLKDTFYWLDAKYDTGKKQYMWGKNKDDGLIEYSNYYFRSPRPTGINVHVDFNGVYQPGSGKEQCIQLSLPFPGSWDAVHNNVVYGYQTTLDERDCESVKTRHAICEGTPDCTFKTDDAFILTEEQQDYFYDGNWLFGDRTYVVNWKYRTLTESKDYCKSLGLKMFVPRKEVTPLIPFLKMWSREVTTSQFWTDATWFKNGEYKDPEGKVLFTSSGNKDKFTEGKPVGGGRKVEARSEVSDDKFCVSMFHAYEFKTQMPCPTKNSTAISQECAWSYAEYVPTNCENYMATICQHEDSDIRVIEWKAEYIKNVHLALNDSAVLGFGFFGNKEVLRSTYKQTFGGLWCPPSYRMLREKNVDWHKKPTATGKDLYTYDFQESYWVVDKGMFDKNADSQCTISTPGDKDGYTRTLKQVRCDTWHFYLCENTGGKMIMPWNFTLNRPNKMEWREGPQPRPYPIRKGR